MQLNESVLDISCRNAAGTAVVATAVADIWKNFQSAPHSNPVQGVKRKAIDGYNVVDSVEMTYWNPVVNSCQSMAAMLASANGDGTCVAWSSLFQATLEVQGITGTGILEITADQIIKPGAAAGQSDIPPGGAQGQGKAVPKPIGRPSELPALRFDEDLGHPVLRPLLASRFHLDCTGISLAGTVRGKPTEYAGPGYIVQTNTEGF